MAFDPDAFLSGGTTTTTGKFDPDAFLNSYTPPAGRQPLQGDAGEYARRIASWQNQQPAQLSPQEMARTGQLTNERGAVTGGTQQVDPFTGKVASEKPLLSSGAIRKALNAVGEIGATERIKPDEAQDSINKAIADRLSGMTSERFVSTLPQYFVPGVAEAQGLEGVSHIPRDFREAKNAGDYTGSALDAAISAMMLGHRLIPAGEAKAEEQWQQNQKLSTTPQTRGETTTPGQATEPSSATSLPPTTQTPARPAAPSSTESGAKNLPPGRGAEETQAAKSQLAEQAPNSQQLVRANGLTPEQQQAYDLHMQWYENEQAINAEKAKPNPSANKIEQLENQQILDAFDEHKLKEGQGSTPPPKNESTGILERSTGVQEPAGTSNRQNVVTYGEGAVPPGQGADTGYLLDKARGDIQSGRVDPYAVLSRTRGNSIASPEDYATLAAEHERLVNDAVTKQRAGDPAAEQAAKYANDFANAIQPHKTAASDLFRLMQGDLNYDMGTPFGIDQYMKAELGRGMNGAERPKFEKISNGIRNGESDVANAIGRADKKVQATYAKVRDIPIEEAAARVRQMLGDCMV